MVTIDESYTPKTNPFRPRNHEDLDAYIFKINEESCHVEILDHFSIMSVEELNDLRYRLLRDGADEPEFQLLAQVIKDVVDRPVAEGNENAM